jgi:hypothetical protein
MNQKYSVMFNDETRMFEVVEWDDPNNLSFRSGKSVAKSSHEWEANADCEILNVGYEYEMSAIVGSEWDCDHV